MFDQVMLCSLHLFGILIAFYLFLIRTLCSTCRELNESLLYVQVFQDTSVYGASASQLLELGVSDFYLCSQTLLSLDSV